MSVLIDLCTSAFINLAHVVYRLFTYRLPLFTYCLTTPCLPDVFLLFTPRLPFVYPSSTPHLPLVYSSSTPRLPLVYPSSTTCQSLVYPSSTTCLPLVHLSSTCCPVSRSASGMQRLADVRGQHLWNSLTGCPPSHSCTHSCLSILCITIWLNAHHQTRYHAPPRSIRPPPLCSPRPSVLFFMFPHGLVYSQWRSETRVPWSRDTGH